jgi:carboxyl-terminal processing protease
VQKLIAAATVAAVCLLSACSSTPRQPAPYVPQKLSAEQRAAAFDQVWQTIDKQYVDPRFNGVDWKAVAERYRPQLLALDDDAAYWRGLNRMVGELKDAHTSVRSPLEANATPTQRGHFGLALAPMDGHIVLQGVAGNSQAALLGVRPGQRVLQVDGMPVQDWWQQAASQVRGSSTQRSQQILINRELNARPVESRLVLQVQPADAGAAPLTVTLQQDPVGPALVGIRSHLLANGVGYLRLTRFDPLMRGALEASLMRLSAAKALVLDLRGNPGGNFNMAIGLLGWLLERPGSVGRIVTRNNEPLTALYGLIDVTPKMEVKPLPNRITVPLAVLVDEGSASASELTAGVLQDQARGRVFGSPSCGCLLGVRSSGEELPGGGRLLFSQFDMQIGNRPRVEGVGVIPDVPVQPSTRALQAGQDTVFETAQAWVLQAAAPAPAGAPR